MKKQRMQLVTGANERAFIAVHAADKQVFDGLFPDKTQPQGFQALIEFWIQEHQKDDLKQLGEAA
ncbi:MAG: hypothetical protein AAF810_01370 [Cyanobacteria bacterium P01_D01_bin.36]